MHCSTPSAAKLSLPPTLAILIMSETYVPRGTVGAIPAFLGHRGQMGSVGLPPPRAAEYKPADSAGGSFPSGLPPDRTRP